MPILSRDEIERIVQRDKPGYHLSPQARGNSASAAADAMRAAPPAAPSDETRYRRLSDKYLGNDAAELDNDDDEVAELAPHELDAPAAADNSNADEMIVAVEPDTAAHPWDRGARPKAVVISVKDKKIIGQQG